MTDFFHILSALDFLLIAAMIAYIIVGFLRGFARTLAGIVGVMVSVIAAVLGAAVLTPYAASLLRSVLAQGLASHLSGSEEALDQIAGAVVAVVQNGFLRTAVYLICYLLAMLFWQYACNYSKVLTKFHSIKTMDQAAGALVGAAKGFIVLSVIIYVVGRFHILPASILENSQVIQRVSGVLQALVG